MIEEKAVAVRGESTPQPASGVQSGQASQLLDMSRFKFREEEITLDSTAAYTIDGDHIMAFGLESIDLGRKAGIDIAKPDTLVIQGIVHSNPYRELGEDGHLKAIYIRKIGTYINQNGFISYLDYTDRIDVAAYVAERVNNFMKWYKGAAARYMTRIIADKLNAAGELNNVWWFVPVENENMGVGFNKAAGDSEVMNFCEEIPKLWKVVERRFHTSVSRRVVASLIPSVLKTTDFKTKTVQKSYKKDGQWRKKDVEVIDTATFKVTCPQAQGFEFAILHKIARAIKENNQELEARALDSFYSVVGIRPQLMIADAELDKTHDPNLEPEAIASEVKEGKGEWEDTPQEIVPPPRSNKAPDVYDYFMEMLPLLNDDQKADLLKAVDVPDMESIKTREHWKAVKKFFKALTADSNGDEPEAEEKINYKDFLAEILAEGSMRLGEILEKDYPGKTFNELTEMDYEVIYKIYTGNK